MNTKALNNTEKTKKPIESIIINSLDDTDDEAIYAYLSKTQPEGNILMSDNEQSDLITRLRKKAL